MCDIESSATVTVPSSSYPKGNVIGLYGLLGGVVGGLILFFIRSVVHDRGWLCKFFYDK